MSDANLAELNRHDHSPPLGWVARYPGKESRTGQERSLDSTMNSQQKPSLPDQQDDSGSADPFTRRSNKLTTVAMVLGFSTLYAVVRYNFFGDVSTHNIPVYILNKSVSLSSVIFLLLAGWRHMRGNNPDAKFWGTSSLHFAMLHIVMSFVLLSESYYPKLYSADMMNLNGEACVLFGALAGYFYVLLGIDSRRHLFLLIKCLAAGSVCLHLFFMGYFNWFKPTDWPGQLPPISLISFLIGVAALVIFLTLLRRNGRSETNADGNK